MKAAVVKPKGQAPSRPANQTVALADISIAWKVEGYGTEPVVLSGLGLARLIAWLGETRPGMLEEFGDDVGPMLQALGKLMRQRYEPADVLDGLADLTHDLASRLVAISYAEQVAKQARVTIRKTEAA